MATKSHSIQAANIRKFWTEFISLYESLPALWDVNNSLYMKHPAKLNGYNELLAKFRQFEPAASLKDVKSKINIFRTCYRRECSRIKNFHQEGKKYETSLWYYDLLKFLEPSLIARKVRINKLRRNCGKRKTLIDSLGAHSSEATDSTGSTSTFKKYRHEMTCDSGSSQENLNEDLCVNENTFQQQFQNKLFQKLQTNNIMSRNGKGENSMMRPSSPITEDDEEIVETSEEDIDATPPNPEILEIEVGERLYDQFPKQTTEQSERGTKTTMGSKSTITIIQSNCRPQHAKPIKRKANADANALPQTGELISESTEMLARSWAAQYAEMCEEQRIYARKAIADILFKGCMGVLGRRDDSDEESIIS